jgi:hypothetical protein
MPDPAEPPAQATEAPSPVDHNGVFLMARELVAIKQEANEISARLDELKKRKAVIDGFLKDAFSNEPSLTGLKVDGYTIYLRKVGWAGATDKAAAYDALVAAGLGDFALRTFNVQSVSALYREWDRNDEQPPAELEGVISFTDTYEIGMTKS